MRDRQQDSVESLCCYLELQTEAFTKWLGMEEKQPRMHSTAQFYLQIEAFTQWLGKEEKQQNKLKAHEEPILLSTAITSRVSQMQSLFDKLNKRKKPAPPPAPPASKEGNTTGTL